LRDEWETTTEKWDDANRAAFEERYLRPLAPQVTLFLATVSRLAEVLERVERDCGEEDERWDP
jgi:hypothetical protein